MQQEQHTDPGIPAKPPGADDEKVVVGYGVTSGGAERWWTRWWRKAWGLVWPQSAGLARRLIVVGVAVLLLVSIPVVAALVANRGNDRPGMAENGREAGGSNEQFGGSSRNGNGGEGGEGGQETPGGENGGNGGGSAPGGSGGNGGPGGGSGSGSGNGGGGSGNGGGTTPPPPPPTGVCPAFPAFPDQNCTGWQHTGVTLHTSDCPTTITTDNATYDSCRFTGAVLIDASNVTITRSRIEGRVVSLSPDDSLLGLTLTDVEVDGQGVWDFNQAAIGNSDYTCTRCHIHSTGRGANLIDNVVIQDSYLHGWVTQDGDHETAIGSNGGSGNKIIHNNLICNSSLGGCSAALSFYGDFAPVNDILVEKNLLNTNGSYCTYAGSVPGKPFPNATNVRYIDNHFGKAYHPGCGAFGPVDSWAFNTGNVWSGNVWADGSGPVNP